jgi:hypothetical protein
MRLLNYISQISIKAKKPTPAATLEQKVEALQAEVKQLKQMVSDLQLISLNAQIEASKR